MLPTTAAPAGSDAFFTRVADPRQDDFGLGNELKELSGVVSWLVLGLLKQLVSFYETIQRSERHILRLSTGPPSYVDGVTCVR